MDQGKICDQTELLAEGPDHTLVLWCTQAELAEGFPAQELLLSVGNGMIPSAMSAQRDDKILVLPNLNNLTDRVTLVKM